MSLREPGRNLQIQSTAPLNVSGSHFRTRRAKPQRPLCPDETCMEVTALKEIVLQNSLLRCERAIIESE